MGTTKVIRYRTKPEFAEQNAELVRAVFAELASSQPEGLRYATFKLDDGCTFLHVAMIEGENPLSSSAAFQRFSAEISSRCDEGPLVADADVVGAYELPFA